MNRNNGNVKLKIKPKVMVSRLEFFNFFSGSKEKRQEDRHTLNRF